MPCIGEAPWQGIAVYVGEPGQDVESTSATLVTSRCDEQGTIGSLVVVPSGAKDEQLGIRVVAGVTRNPEQCAEQNYEGCIVARRSVRFTPHESLELTVELARDCVSIGCDPEHTCRSGRCIDSELVAPLSVPMPVDGPSVRCGDDGVRCATEGDVCCLTVHPDSASATGECRPAALCDQPSMVLYCDDDSDCEHLDSQSAERGGPPFCAINYVHADVYHLPKQITGSSCGFASPNWLVTHFGLGLCQEGKPCVDNRFQCGFQQGSELLPNYLWCQIQVEEPLQ